MRHVTSRNIDYVPMGYISRTEITGDRSGITPPPNYSRKLKIKPINRNSRRGAALTRAATRATVSSKYVARDPSCRPAAGGRRSWRRWSPHRWCQAGGDGGTSTPPLPDPRATQTLVAADLRNGSAKQHTEGGGRSSVGGLGERVGGQQSSDAHLLKVMQYPY